MHRSTESTHKPTYWLRTLGTAVAGICCSMAVYTAHATPINGAASGLSSSDVIEDFGNALFPDFTPVTSEFGASGVQLIGAEYFTTSSSFGLQLGFITGGRTASPPLRIQFSSNVSDVSFVLNAPSATITALLGGSSVSSFTASPLSFTTGLHYGFTGLVFDEIQVNFSGDYNLDNLAYNRGPDTGIVPLPATLPMALAGLGVLSACRMWRRRA